MATILASQPTTTTTRRQPSSSTQLTKPISIPTTTTTTTTTSSSSSNNNSNNNVRQRPSFFSQISYSPTDDNAVLDDSDVHSEDELPPSPMRRHSGAMSISQEDLSSCYDREALRRETAAHRARHLHQHQHQETQAFALHEEWDCEVDGPHMALWTPQSSQKTDAANHHLLHHGGGGISSHDSKRRRMHQEPHFDHQVSYIEGPMMCLWEP